MPDDFVRTLGYLGVTARLKRLSEIFSKEIREFYRQENIPLEPGWHLYILFLNDNPQAAMSELAVNLGVSLPAVHKVCEKMEKAGFVKITKAASDKRKTCVELTGKTKKALPRFKAIWAAGSQSVADMLAKDTRFLGALENLENAQARASFRHRAAGYLGGNPVDRVAAKDKVRPNSEITPIGNTPLIKLKNIVPEGAADIYVKLEGANPTGSMKDRMALSMIEGAERRGQLKPGYRVVEYTGGSTGSSLAMVCAMKGYKAHFVSSDGFSDGKIKTMKAFGAAVEIIPAKNRILTAGIIDQMIARAKELAQKSDTFWPDQVNNLDNKRGYHSMGREILADLGPDIDEFVMAVGGGGCISGNAEILKAAIPHLKVTAVEPLNVRNISGGDTSGTHRLEGIGLSFVPSILRRDLVDNIIAVSDEDAFAAANLLAKREGILGGITSGANLWAALERAKTLGPGKTIVTVIIDSGLRYLNSDLFK